MAERIRPSTMDKFIGQQNIVGPESLLLKSVKKGQLFSSIFWGPPGSGKTTLARIIARETGADYYTMSAVSSGVRELRKMIEFGKTNQSINKVTVLFIDEIHRFNKAQQDALLHAVEDGSLILLGATTENPSFEVISPLLSRCRVFKLKSLTSENLSAILKIALTDDVVLQKLNIQFENNTQELLIQSSGGDARKMLNTLEGALTLAENTDSKYTITKKAINEALQKKTLIYDKAGDYHYDTISAFIKSVRGSDPDAAIYWLAVMLEGGEKPEFIARRLIILASEDIGNADPQALILATSCFQAVHIIGMPESSLILSQVTAYLASAQKSNAATLAIGSAGQKVKETGTPSVPLHLRNAPTLLMKSMDYGKDYDYPHNRPDHFVDVNYFPDGMKPGAFYKPTNQGYEEFIRKRLSTLWKDRYE
tara:strand:+ start:18339 stop:19607 length:1269 start_codon:yes stop_codon:yes gene_type:complete